VSERERERECERERETERERERERDSERERERDPRSVFWFVRGFGLAAVLCWVDGGSWGVCGLEDNHQTLVH
jgi:hypothetical protein